MKNPFRAARVAAVTAAIWAAAMKNPRIKALADAAMRPPRMAPKIRVRSEYGVLYEMPAHALLIVRSYETGGHHAPAPGVPLTLEIEDADGFLMRFPFDMPYPSCSDD